MRGVHPLSMLSGYKQPLNISRGVQPLLILSGVYNNHYQYFQVYNLYKCYQGCTTLSMLLGVHNL